MSHIPPTSPPVNTPHTEKLTAAAWAVRDALLQRFGRAVTGGSSASAAQAMTYLGRAKLAKTLNLSVRTISRAITQLCRTGHLRRGKQQYLGKGKWTGMPIYAAGLDTFQRIGKEIAALNRAARARMTAKRSARAARKKRGDTDGAEVLKSPYMKNFKILKEGNRPDEDGKYAEIRAFLTELSTLEPQERADRLAKVRKWQKKRL